MSDFPNTRHTMLRAGYVRKGNGICKACSAPIEWWKTNNGKSIPMNPPPDDNTGTEAHFATCPQAAQFRGAGAPPAAQPPRQPASRATLEDVAEKLCRQYGLRVVVLIAEDGTAASWKDAISAEDIRHELISAGNDIRSKIHAKEEAAR